MLQVNKCDIFGRGNTKSLALRFFFCYSGLVHRRQDKTSAMNPRCHGRSRESDPSRFLRLFQRVRDPDRRFLKTGTTRGENLSSSSSSSSFITITVISCFFGKIKKDNKHPQRYNHALTDPRKNLKNNKGRDGFARGESRPQRTTTTTTTTCLI